MKVAVVGLGYVGAVTAACFAHEGHEVVGIDTDAHKVALLASGTSPIVEPRLQELVEAAVTSGRFSAVTDSAGAIAASDVTIVCVGTPSRSDGTVDLRFVERVAESIGEELAAHPDANEFPVIAFRSTLPPGTVEERLLPVIEAASGQRAGEHFGVAMCPEFLREGSGVEDFFHPPFSVAGTRDPRSLASLTRLFGSLDGPVRAMPIRAAESLKYACNAFHAVKVTFANEIGRLLQASGVDARDVMTVFCEDDQLNISPAYLRPGFAFGGSCLPKDLRAVMHQARVLDVDVPMLASVLPSNDSHLRRIVRRVLDTGARQVALLGLSFKAGTDDLRESPYVELAETLVGKGVQVRIYDPVVQPERLFGTNLHFVETHLPHLQEMLSNDPDEALAGAPVAIVGTADAAVVEAVARVRPPHVIDLSGRLGPDVETLPGYEGAAW